MFTLKQVISSPLEEIQACESHRQSSSAPRTFNDVLPWPEFVTGACHLEDSLDDTDRCYDQPTSTLKRTYIRPAADECEVRGTLLTMLKQRQRCR